MTTTPDYHTDVADGPTPQRLDWLHTADGTRLRAGCWAGSRGTIWLFQGRTEYIEKYAPTIDRLTRAGWAVVTHDWRGQGLSDRPRADRNLGDIQHFSQYQQDVAALLAHAPFTALPKPWVLFAHSMGGAIGLETLTGVHPFKAAIFSAPMWDLPRPKLVGPLAEAGLILATKLGFGGRYFFGGGPTNAALSQPFAINTLTGDAENYATYLRHLKARPELALGGPSMRWVRAALLQAAHLRRLPPPDLPILTVLGGREMVVSPEAIRSQTARQPHAHLVEIPGARHEILIETPERQAQAWSEIDAFLEKL
ncbi:MAG: alpha/beta hydrolase [Pseudomonadota bacterium]